MTTLHELPKIVLPDGGNHQLDEPKNFSIKKNIALEGQPTLILDEFKPGKYGGWYWENTCDDDTYEALERDPRKDCAGQLHAKQMLQHQDKIPIEWREFTLVFTGTVFVSDYGNNAVSYMIWKDDLWKLEFWLVSNLAMGDYNKLRLVHIIK